MQVVDISFKKLILCGWEAKVLLKIVYKFSVICFKIMQPINTVAKCILVGKWDHFNVTVFFRFPKTLLYVFEMIYQKVALVSKILVIYPSK